MKRFFKSIFIASIGLFFITTLSSCKKEGCTDETALNYDSEAEKDDDSCEFPEIDFSIANPVSGATYMPGDTVFIDGTITSTGEVHGYELSIVKSSDGTVVFSEEGHVHDSPVEIHTFWVVDVTEHTGLTLDIALITDHDGHTEHESVEFHCHGM